MPPTETDNSRLRPTRIHSSIQLLVEGKDALNWFQGLARHLSLEGLQIQNYGGVDDLRVFLKALVKMPDFSTVTSIGIVRDAEDSADGACASVKGALEQAGLPVPSCADARRDGHPSVSLLILPDGRSPRMLESVLSDIVRSTPVGACIEKFLRCADESVAESKVKRSPKAFVHAFLATKPHPHVSVGVAAKKGYWDLGHPALKGVRSFLSDLASA